MLNENIPEVSDGYKISYEKLYLDVDSSKIFTIQLAGICLSEEGQWKAIEEADVPFANFSYLRVHYY